MSAQQIDLSISSLASLYRVHRSTPAQVLREIHARADKSDAAIWIHRVPLSKQLSHAERLMRDPAALKLPLYGIPFAVKDNIDVEGLPTTAACPDYAYVARHTAPSVQRLLDAGAICIGKTNLDQFATGLVGTRSPYGAVSNPFDARYISGGSSSGSAVAVATGLASFALGTDTAGSGRVPAAFCNIVGLKPTRGLLSSRGIMPACRTLDCVSIFALNALDAQTLFDVSNALDSQDPCARLDREACRDTSAPTFRFGIPDTANLEFFGDDEYRRLYEEAIARVEELGGTAVPVDVAPLLEAADLLYNGPWVAERYVATREFMDRSPQSLVPVIEQVIGAARNFSAADTFAAMYTLADIRLKTRSIWSQIDALLLPTAASHYTIAAVNADPIHLNSRLGRYTNFVNLLDLSAIAVPSGFTRAGLPFGVSFIAPAMHDRLLCALGGRYHAATGLKAGAMQTEVPPYPLLAEAKDEVALAVVGAHLQGLPLNHQLVTAGARLLRSTRTEAAYSLYALPNTTPPKPGLVRDGDSAIDVEVWSFPLSTFGAFVASIPAPLGIGTLRLEDGSEVKGFLCEAHAVVGANDISALGGWRAYLKAQT
ncbi:MAG TPA: allophanate hydrolase [Burkholderiales bacterium]|jgi:allophanate hydrolase|nr:allophanate hydrolase [Burkholderiales bacterium]